MPAGDYTWDSDHVGIDEDSVELLSAAAAMIRGRGADDPLDPDGARLEALKTGIGMLAELNEESLFMTVSALDGDVLRWVAAQAVLELGPHWSPPTSRPGGEDR